MADQEFKNVVKKGGQKVNEEWQISNKKMCGHKKKNSTKNKKKFQRYSESLKRFTKREWQIKNSKKCGEAKKYGKEKM